MKSRVRSLALTLLVTTAFAAPDAARAEFAHISDDFYIHYMAVGEGKVPIVFVPGWTMSSEVFVRQFAHFEMSKRYRFISFDPRSQGVSTHTSTGNNYEQHGRDLRAFLSALKLQGVILAGWSNGAFDILSYVHQFGHGNLKALILIDGPPKCAGQDDKKEWVWYRRDDADHYRETLTMGMLRARQKTNDEFAESMVENSSPAYLEWMGGITNQTSDEVAALLNETCAYLDFESDLEGLNGKLPLLYVLSEENGKVASNWAKAHTPTATVRALGKHLMFWEHATEFDTILDDFLTAHP